MVFSLFRILVGNPMGGYNHSPPTIPGYATARMYSRTTMPNVDVQLNEYVMSNRARTLIAQNAYILRFSPLPYWHMR